LTTGLVEEKLEGGEDEEVVVKAGAGVELAVLSSVRECVEEASIR